LKKNLVRLVAATNGIVPAGKRFDVNIGKLADNTENSAIPETIYNAGCDIGELAIQESIRNEFGVEIPPQRLGEIFRRLIESEQSIKSRHY
jgi:hypothetical protein